MVRLGSSAWPWLAAALLTGAAQAELSPEGDTVQLEAMTVNATRRESLELETPVSVTAVPLGSGRGDLDSLKDLGRAVPNASFLEFTARAISNPQFRGVGGSTTNPGITTYIDGVPQLSADTSSQELLDVSQVEFIRGAQGALYGRNTLGGVITVDSRAPHPDWSLGAQAGLGRESARVRRLAVGGPLFTGDAAFSLAGGYNARDGYSTNLETGRALDSRKASFGKFQALAGVGEWTVRGILSAESAHDGDFALYDLAALRAAPHAVRHDYTGHTRRVLQSQTLQVTRLGDEVHFRSITGRVGYEAFETTDLDASEQDDLRRFNRRGGEQLTEELQWASALDRRWRQAPELRLGWIGGLFAFRQRTGQDVLNTVTQSGLARFASFVIPTVPVGLPPTGFDPAALNVPIEDVFGAEDRGRAALEDLGGGVYGQGELSIGDNWQLALGLRYDRERKRGVLNSEMVYETPGGPQSPDGPQHVAESREYSSLTPALRLSWQRGALMAYASAARGYRAGGFNAIAPAGSESYGPEQSLNLEAGLKAGLWDDRAALTVAVFDIRLEQLQLNTPVQGGAGRFFIQNAGGARNRGVELEMRGAVAPWFEPWLSLGVLDARFTPGSRNLGEDVGGRRLPFADPLRGALGATLKLPGLVLHPDVQRFGNYSYDASGSRAMEAVTLVNLRALHRTGPLQLELWARNLTDEAYIPLAIPYTGIAPSDYVGENAAPRTLGFTLLYDLH